MPSTWARQARQARDLADSIQLLAINIKFEEEAKQKWYLKNAEALQLVPCFLIYDSDVFNFVNVQVQTPEVFCKKSYS